MSKLELKDMVIYHTDRLKLFGFVCFRDGDNCVILVCKETHKIHRVFWESMNPEMYNAMVSGASEIVDGDFYYYYQDVSMKTYKTNLAYYQPRIADMYDLTLPEMKRVLVDETFGINISSEIGMLFI